MGDICSNKLCYLDNNEEDLNYYIIKKKEVYNLIILYLDC